MIAAFATLAFLATLWLTVVTAARLLEESGGKIIAALKGCSPLAVAPAAVSPPIRISARQRARMPVRARPQLRAAA